MSQLNFSCLVPWNFRNRKGHSVNLSLMFFCYYYYYFFCIMIYFILQGEGFRLSHTMTNLIWDQIHQLRDSNLSLTSEDKYYHTIVLSSLLLFNITLFFLLSHPKIPYLHTPSFAFVLINQCLFFFFVHIKPPFHSFFFSKIKYSSRFFSPNFC